MARNAKSKPAAVEVEKPVCAFCKKAFSGDKVIARHLCRLKARFLDRDLPAQRLGFVAFQIFYRFNYRKTVDGEYFRKSKHYELFVKFGAYMVGVKVHDPSDFSRFVIEKGASLPITKWPTDAVYETYLHHKNMTEMPEAAAERTILLMEQWSVESGNDFRDFFRLIPGPLAVQFIRSGRISPWMLYATKSGQELLQRLGSEELNIVAKHINPALWKRRITLHAQEVENLSVIFEEVGL